MTDNHKTLLWLCSLPKFKNNTIKKLVEHFTEIRYLWKASKEELSSLSFLTPYDITILTEKKYQDGVDRYIELMYRHGISMLSYWDKDFPNLLQTIYNPPNILFYKGSLKPEETCLAVIGSRRATNYGYQMSEIISRSLSERGFTVVSGLARGIDSRAHAAVIGAKGRTIAVLGSGLDMVYPKENQRLFENIQEQGMVISEYYPGTPPMPHHFPLRNRIISGLSKGVIVIEAGEKSGSLITADLALEQGREVFAVPGNVSNQNSIGTNRLIRDGAKMITGIQDILDGIQYFDDASRGDAIRFQAESRILGKVLNTLDSQEKKIVLCLSEEDLHVDELMKKTQMEMSVLNASLIMLELQGIIEQKPGKIYSLQLPRV